MNSRKLSFPIGTMGYNKYTTHEINKSLWRNQVTKTPIKTKPYNNNVNYNVNNVRKQIPTNINKNKKRVTFKAVQTIDVESYKEYTLRDTYEAEKIMQNMIDMIQGREREKERIRCCFGKPSLPSSGENVKDCCYIF